MINVLTGNPLLLATIVLALVSLALIATTIVLWLKLHRFLAGPSAHDVGESIHHIKSDLDELKNFRDELEKYLATVEKRLKKSVQAVETVRFNPWSGTGQGGAQSFATAFLNEDGHGVVISSLYARDHVSIFGKSIKKYLSEHELSNEESQAVENAKNQLH